MVQDNPGFIWLGTQYGLNRFDGYKSKVFKHEPGRPDTLSCVYIRSLFVDHSGTLWVGCDRFLDKFEPITETFAHYRIDQDAPGHLPTPIDRIHEDDSGILWLATAKGLYRFDPATGKTSQYTHDPGDPTSVSGNRINVAGEDRRGRFWIASSGGLDEFDRKTGKAIWHVPLREEVSQFHEDKFGVFWMVTSNDPACALATLNRETHSVTCHSIDYETNGAKSPVTLSALLESQEGTVWLGSTIGLLKFDRQQRQLVNYQHNASDSESLESNSVINLYQDREGNIWTCLQDTEPNLLSERPPAFENFTYQRGSLVSPLVTSIYEDHNGILWIGSMGGLNRIDRRSGKDTVPAGTGVHNEILSVLEDHSGVLFAGTFHKGLQRLDPETGKAGPYVRSSQPSNLDGNPIMRLIFDHEGTLWAATYGGLSRFDPATGNFITYTPEEQNTIQYQEIKQDSHGTLWLGAQSGLHRFDPHTGRFTIYEHDLDNPRSLSDNRVNSVHFDRSGNLWVGTQNGLDELDPGTGSFKTYYEQDGLAGNVVSCILEDGAGRLWMGTNNGLSTFDPATRKFENFSVADGLPGPDLTGWGACYQTPSGEMFFGGFSGATAFYPSRIVNSSFVPRTVLTNFWLSGSPVPIGPKSPLTKSIGYTGSITLSHAQNDLAIEFSALSYFDAATNRYRYRLESLDHGWHEAGSDQRIVSYTTLPAGSYVFRVQGATSRGAWSEPGATLRIEILPAWYETSWFRALCAVAFLALLWGLYQARVHQLRREEKKLREAMETMPTMAWIAGPGGTHQFVNRRWAEYTGQSQAGTDGKGWKAVVHPEDAERYVRRWLAVLASGDPFEEEVRLRRADGEYRWFLSRAVPLRDKRGEIRQWYGVSTDIQDRKRAEQLQADLAHTNRVSMLGELAASISHELKQPITATITNARTTQRWLKHDQPDLEEVRLAAERIEKDGARATDIIDRLRSLYKKAPPKRELAEVNEIVGEMVVMLRGEAHRSGVSIRTGFGAGLPRITADRVQLQQVLMNLMLNGIQAMNNTGGVLTVTSEWRDEQVVISVSDTGVGLPAGKIDRMFDAFFTTKPQGSGMGLAISRSIVESHGGRLWATPNDLRGATFHFSLPTPTETGEAAAAGT